MGGIYKERPGAADISPARPGDEAVSIGNGIWMSSGVSNSYAIATDDGRVVINAGLPFEGVIRRAAYDAACPGQTRFLLFTQGHADHFSGYRRLLDTGTDIVMQKNWRRWKAEHELLPKFRPSRASFAWSHMSEAMIAGMSLLSPEEWNITFPEPTIDFDDRLELTVGGRTIVLLATPGGETTDSLVVWLPDERTVFTGNLFGPLFGHVPNLVTMRGDRYREAPDYIASANRVLELGAERLVTGHFEPIEGAARIAEEVTNLRDAMQWVHDRVIEGMESGADVLTLMRDIKLPARFEIGEGYGKTSWNVRAIWETYSGWFHHRSTTELFHVPASAIARDVVAAAGAESLVAAARARIAAGEYLEAIHLVELVLAVEPDDKGAREVGAAAHEALLEQSDNYWEQAWLRRAADQLKVSP